MQKIILSVDSDVYEKFNMALIYPGKLMMLGGLSPLYMHKHLACIEKYTPRVVKHTDSGSKDFYERHCAFPMWAMKQVSKP
jgi:hypothetical protein